MNRAVARRPMFESELDMQRFFDLMGEVAERGWLRWHSFVVLQTHFHALVESPSGEMSKAMRHLQLGYVRYFNRSRRRDGPLMRGRFRSILAQGSAYRRLLVGYIDANPVEAGLVAATSDYPFGSSRYYVHGGGPSWLTRNWIESIVADRDGNYCAQDYVRTFGRGFQRVHATYVEARSRLMVSGHDPTDRLLAGGAPAMRTWMRRKAWLADRVPIGAVLAPVDAVLEVVEQRFGTRCSRKDAELSMQVTAHLLRELCAATHGEIADLFRTSRQAVGRLLRRFQRELRDDSELLDSVAELADLVLRSVSA